MDNPGSPLGVSGSPDILWDMTKIPALALTLFLATLTAAPTLGAPAVRLEGVVAKVHDGDTFTLVSGQKIRVFGIDAPELHQQCRAGAIHAPGPSPCVPCGEASRQALEELILGKEVRCESRGQSYDRMVGECTVGKIQVGPWMLTHGHAVVSEQYLKKKDRAAYVGAQSGAKRANEGIWAMTFIPPADWRNHKQRLECER